MWYNACNPRRKILKFNALMNNFQQLQSKKILVVKYYGGSRQWKSVRQNQNETYDINTLTYFTCDALLMVYI